MNIKKWLEKNTKDLNGKVIAITGSTGGLGKELCFHLASLGASLILMNRNQDKTNNQINSLIVKFPNIKVDFIQVDMQDFESVKNATEKLKTKNVDILLLNAGAYKIPRVKTELGYDNIFTINFILPYYMVKELLPSLRNKEDSKVVVVGSIAHNYSKINEQEIDFSQNKKCSRVYGNAKRFLMFSLYELFRNENNVKLSICHPGITYTNITSHYPKLINKIIKYPMKVIFMNPRKASLSIIKGVFDETSYHTWIGPKIFNIWGYPKKKTLKTAKKQESEKIFQLAESINKNLNNKK